MSSQPLYLDAGRATLPEIEAFVRRCPYAILPVGSTEQHGPHLPINTDTVIAEAMARETAKLSCGLVLPAVPLGYAWVWRDVPATLTLSFDTYMRMIRDTVESLSRWGIRAVYIMSGHGSNPQPLKHALREMIHEKLEVKVLYGMYSGLKQMIAESESETWHGDLHADEIETSLMLALAPDLVRMELAAADYPPAPADYGQSALSMGNLMRSGVFGAPTRATAEKGRRMLVVVVERLSGFLVDLSAATVDERFP